MSEVNVERRNIIERIQKKIKSSNLKPEEIQAIDKARSQVYNQTSIGGFVGAVGTFLIGRKRRISPFLKIPLVAGGFLIGSQVGMVSGIMSGMRTINKLPDQARLVNLVREIQVEVMNANGYTQDDPKSRPRPMTPEEKSQYQQKLLNQQDDDTSSKNDKNDDPWWTENDYSKTNSTSDSFNTTGEKIWGDGYTPSQDKLNDNGFVDTNSDDSNINNSSSAWDRIRQENNKQ